MKVANVILFLSVWPMDIVTFAWDEDPACYKILGRGGKRAKRNDRDKKDKKKDRQKKRRKKKKKKKRNRLLEQNNRLPKHETDQLHVFTSENQVGNVTHWDNKPSFSYLKHGTQEEALPIMEHDEELTTEMLEWKLRGRKMRERAGDRPVDPKSNEKPENVDTLVSLFQKEGGGKADQQPVNFKKKPTTSSSLVQKSKFFPSGDYGLKLWWEEDYSCWQFENFDREWCMHYAGEYPDVQRCDTRSSMRVTVEVIRESSDQLKRIKMGDKCFERVLAARGDLSERIDLRTCETENEMQWFLFIGPPEQFEIRPYTSQKKCITQEHHPKPNEPLFCQRCTVAKADYHRTAWWEFYRG